LKDKIFNESNRLKLSYCYGGIVTYDPGEVLGPRLLTDFELVIVIEGTLTYENDTSINQLKPGSILLAKPNTMERYSWDKNNHTRHAYLHFNLDSIPSEWQNLESWPAIIESPSDVLTRLVQTLIDRAMAKPNWPAESPGATQNRLMEVFLDLFLNFKKGDVFGGQDSFSEPVSRAVKFIRERLDSRSFEPFTLDELSKSANTSSKNLCRIFIKEIGISPMKASRLMQLQLAIPLLARTRLSIKEIAQHCGFCDQLYFSRYFSQVFGAPPSEVRKKLLSGNPPPKSPLPASLMPRMYW